MFKNEMQELLSTSGPTKNPTNDPTMIPKQQIPWDPAAAAPSTINNAEHQSFVQVFLLILFCLQFIAHCTLSDTQGLVCLLGQKCKQ